MVSVAYILRLCGKEQNILILIKGYKHKIIAYKQDSMVGIQLESHIGNIQFI